MRNLFEKLPGTFSITERAKALLPLAENQDWKIVSPQKSVAIFLLIPDTSRLKLPNKTNHTT